MESLGEMQTKEVFNRFREMIEERTRPCIQHLEGAPYAYVWGENYIVLKKYSECSRKMLRDFRDEDG